MQKNNISIVFTLNIIILILAVIAQIHGNAEYEAKERAKEEARKNKSSSTSSLLFEPVDTDDKTTQEEEPDPTANYIKTINDINPEILEELLQNQRDEMEAAIARDPARDAYFGDAVVNYYGYDTLDFYNKRGKYLDNIQLHSMYLLQLKTNKKSGVLLLCYTADYHVDDKQLTCYFPFENNISLNDKYDEKPLDALSYHEKAGGGKASYDEWYTDNITKIKNRYKLIDQQMYQK